MLKCKVSIVGMNAGMAKDPPSNFRKSLWKQDQRLGWRPQPCRSICRIQIIRLGPRLMPPEGSDRSLGIATLALYQ